MEKAKSQKWQKQVSGKVSKIVLGICIALIIFCVVFVFLIPKIYDHMCRTRVYNDFNDKINEDILSANICIVRRTEEYDEDDPDVVRTVYSNGASGVIFDKKDDTYYALTAYHVAISNRNELFVLDRYTPTYDEKKEQESGKHIPIHYYQKMPGAKIEYMDKSNDVAVISFQSDRELGVLPLSDEDDELNERIAVISNTNGQRDHISYGEITTEETEMFYTKDNMAGTPVLYHNAYVTLGTSGGAIINENMEIVGMNIGAATDILGDFRYGAMIPVEKLREAVNSSQISVDPNES